MRWTNLTYLLIIFIALFSSVARDTFAQGNQGVFTPSDFATVNGSVTLRGTATDDDFVRYEIAYLQASNPGAGWIVFATGNSPVINGTLGVWNTMQGQDLGLPVFPDGAYQLRMRIVRSNQSFSEHFVNSVKVDNSTLQATPEPDADAEAEGTATVDPAASTTPDGTETTTPFATPIPSSTPFQTRIAPTPIPGEEQDTPEPQPDILPSLTPIPLPTPTENVDGFITDDDLTADVSTNGDTTLDSVLNFDFGKVREGFRTGAMVPFLILALIGIYTLLRNFLRWIWRTVSDTNF